MDILQRKENPQYIKAVEWTMDVGVSNCLGFSNCEISIFFFTKTFCQE
jgi:hypothetical protein